MASNDDNYLPEGWTEDMYENPLQHEAAWDALTDEQFTRLQQRRVASVPGAGVPAPPQEPLPAPCVEAIEQAALSEWGFSIFRTDYSDADKWSAFVSRFNELVDAQLTPAAGAGIDDVRDDLRMNWIENRDRLDGADANAVRAYAGELASGADESDTLHFQAVLMVDAAAVDAVLNYQPRKFPPETPLQEKRRGSPWVWAVDVEFDGEDEEYDGQLKVAVDALINDLFPIIATGRQGMEELIPSDGDDGIWFAAYNPY